MYQPMKRGRERAADLITKAGYERPHQAHGGHADFAEDAKMIKKAVAEHESHDHPGEKKTRIHLRDGGHAGGEMEHRRLDHRARGGSQKEKHSPQINIGIAPQSHPAAGPGMGAAPPTAMPPRPPMAPPPMAAPPPRPMPPPPGAMPPGGMPPGAPPGGMPMRPPGMMKDGGHARRQMGGPGMGAPGMPPPGNQQMTPQQMQAMQAMSQGNPPAGGTATSKKGGRAHRKDGGEMGDGGVGGSPKMTAGAGSGEGRREKRARSGAENWGTGH